MVRFLNVENESAANLKYFKKVFDILKYTFQMHFNYFLHLNAYNYNCVHGY